MIFTSEQCRLVYTKERIEAMEARLRLWPTVSLFDCDGVEDVQAAVDGTEAGYKIAEAYLATRGYPDE